MKLFKMFKRGQKGFTLVELMVVMAIIAVLAAIVIPPVTGTKQVSSDTQVKQDASAVSSAVGKVNANANAAENVVTATGSGTLLNVSQITSNKWPEMAISGTVFPSLSGNNTIPANLATRTNYSNEFIAAVTLYDKDGTTSICGGSVTTFAQSYNALDFCQLIAGGYIQQAPMAATAMFQSTPYHNYLFVLKKVGVEGAAPSPSGLLPGRVLEVYSLTTAHGSASGGMATTASGVSTDQLTYQRIY